MPFVQAKCPECGGMLAVDDSKKAAICQFCGNAFIVQEAVNNYNTYNTTNNTYNNTYNTDNRSTHNYSDGTVVNVYENKSSVSVSLERGFILLKDGDFSKANGYFEKVLDIEPKNARAYLGKLMVDLKITSEDSFAFVKENFENNGNYRKIMAFGDEKIKRKLENYLSFGKENANKQVTTLERRETLRKNAEEKTKERKKLFLKPQIERAIKLQRLISIRNCGLGVSSDGRVFSNRNKDVTIIDDIVACSEGGLFDLFLKSNGSCVVKTMDITLRDNIKDWNNIVDISTGLGFAVGLKSDGRVVALGSNNYGQCDVQGWTDIVAISAYGNHTVGLKSNGTVVSAGVYGSQSNDIKDIKLNPWRDIVAISTSDSHTVGLKSDGTVVADGDVGCYVDIFNPQKPSVSTWRDIIAVAAGNLHTVGLKSNGTVVFVGNVNSDASYNLKKWSGIVAISAGLGKTIGLKYDGTVVLAGVSNFASNWKLFNDINNIEEERRLAKTEREHKQKEEFRSKGRCQYCGGVLKGFLSKKCVKCGKPKDY